jgi:hypothetical protein
MDDKAIHAAMDRLVHELNASLPSGWRAARGLATNMAPAPGADEVRITLDTPIWKDFRILPNPYAGQPATRTKEPPYVTLYLLPKYRQDEATYAFGDCPFVVYDERLSLVAMPEGLNRQYDEAMKVVEKVLTKQPEPASERVSAHDKFQTDSTAFYEKAASLRLEGLQDVVQYEHLPTSDGSFSNYIDVLCALPPRKEHYPLIIRLLQKSDPYLQEAGIKLATSSVNRLNDYSDMEAPICALLKQPDLDPWVLEAIVQFASVACKSRSPDLVNFWSEFAAAAYERRPATTAPTPGKTRFIMRQMGIQPYEDARRWVVQLMLSSTNPTPRSEAVLPYLERAFRTKGWADTYRAAGQHH